MRLHFRHFVSGLHIAAPAPSCTNDAVVYMATLAAPAHLFTAPAQPHATDAVMYMALFVHNGLRRSKQFSSNPQNSPLLDIFHAQLNANEILLRHSVCASLTLTLRN